MEKENKRTYNEICKRMEELRKNSCKEEAHIEADKLLVEALSLFGAKRLVNAYEKVDKWYA
jgi:hypothetical protein